MLKMKLPAICLLWATAPVSLADMNSNSSLIGIQDGDEQLLAKSLMQVQKNVAACSS